MQPESQPPAPAVVAVVVTCDPGTWFGQVVASLAAQDYPNLSVLVIDAGSAVDPTPTVAGSLPGAFVRRLGERVGFATAVNEVLTMVEGASHLLVCHDDVVLAPDAIRLMLEEAFRSNAGIVTPKFVMWDAPDRLLAVGATTDRIGVMRDLVDPGELDQEQHDSVREVLVAPGGATLIRFDLFVALGGYAPSIGQFGEDLDLSWRARILGARIVTSPSARVGHLQAIRHGERSGWSVAARRRATHTEEANRITTLATCYRWYDLLWVLPIALFWLVGEATTELLRGRPSESIRVVGAFFLAFRHPGALWRARRRAQHQRGVGDASIRRLQSKGNTRFRAFVRSRAQEVWAGIPHPALPGRPALTAYDDREEEQAIALSAARAAEEAGAPRPSRKIDLIILLALVVVLVFGTRNLLGSTLPAVGQLPKMYGGWSGIWRSWWSDWQPSGLGSPGPSTPAFALLGVLGTVLFGAMGTMQHLVVLGPLIIGPLGAYRAAHHWGSRRGQMIAAVAYAVVPLPYDSLARGRWDGLVAFALAPWILSALGRLSDEIPFASTRLGRIPARTAGLAILVAIVASIAPAFLFVVPIVGLGLLAGSALAGRPFGGVRVLAVSVIGAGAGFVLLLPWSATIITSGPVLAGPALGSSGRLSFGEILRFQTGPFGNGWLGWALLAAAALPLLIGRSWRLAWATRLWSVAILLFLVAWAGRRGWVPAVPLEVILAPAAAALSSSAALGAAAFALDLPGYRFGWRQAAAAIAGVALALAAIPFVVGSAGGRWRMPSADANSVLTVLPDSHAGDYRVLWVGAPDALPLASRELYPGIAYGTSFDGTPSLSDQFLPGSAGATPQLASDLTLVEDRQTTKLGHLLAPAAVRFLVIPNDDGPSGSGSDAVQVPNALLAGLGLQTDMQLLNVDPDYSIYENAAWAPARTVLPTGTAATVASEPSETGRRAVQELRLSGSPPVLTGGRPTSARGAVPAGSLLFVSATRSGRWRLQVAGTSVASQPAFGWAMSFQVPTGSTDGDTLGATLTYRAPLLLGLVKWVEILVWLAAVGFIVVDAARRRGRPGEETVEPDWFVPLAAVAPTRRRRRVSVGPGPLNDLAGEEVWTDV